MHNHILVTGGAGFVGSTLCLDLKQRQPGAKISALDNLHRRGSELNVPRLKAAGVEFLHGDIRCPEDLEGLEPDLILECSAEPSAQAGYGGSPAYLIRSNLEGCFNCLELARRTKSDFLFISTSRVYPYRPLNQLRFVEDEERFTLTSDQPFPGASEKGVSELFPLEGARSLYGMTKCAAELIVQEYGDAYGIRHIINRCGLLTGPWQMGKTDQGVIALWVAAHYFRRPLSYIGFNGTGKQVRDFLHIQDLCDLIWMQINDFKTYGGKILNAGGGLECTLSLRESTKLCAEITGNRIEIKADLVDRPADVRSYVTDYGRLNAIAGWRPKRLARETLTDIFEWIRREELLVRGVLG